MVSIRNAAFVFRKIVRIEEHSIGPGIQIDFDDVARLEIEFLMQEVQFIAKCAHCTVSDQE